LVKNLNSSILKFANLAAADSKELKDQIAPDLLDLLCWNRYNHHQKTLRYWTPTQE